MGGKVSPTRAVRLQDQVSHASGVIGVDNYGIGIPARGASRKSARSIDERTSGRLRFNPCPRAASNDAFSQIVAPSESSVSESWIDREQELEKPDMGKTSKAKVPDIPKRKRQGDICDEQAAPK